MARRARGLDHTMVWWGSWRRPCYGPAGVSRGPYYDLEVYDDEFFLFN